MSELEDYLKQEALVARSVAKGDFVSAHEAILKAIDLCPITDHLPKLKEQREIIEKNLPKVSQGFGRWLLSRLGGSGSRP